MTRTGWRVRSSSMMTGSSRCITSCSLVRRHSVFEMRPTMMAAHVCRSCAAAPRETPAATVYRIASTSYARSCRTRQQGRLNRTTSNVVRTGASRCRHRLDLCGAALILTPFTLTRAIAVNYCSQRHRPLLTQLRHGQKSHRILRFGAVHGSNITGRGASNRRLFDQYYKSKVLLDKESCSPHSAPSWGPNPLAEAAQY